MSTQYSDPLTNDVEPTKIPQPGSAGPEAVAGVRIVSWSAAGLAWDSQKLVFAFQFYVAWTVGTLLLVVLGSSTSDDGEREGFNQLGWVFAWTFACVQLFLAGVARMITAGIQNQDPKPRRAAWAFLLRHGAGVVLGGVGLAAAVGVVLTGFVFVVRGLSSSSETGLLGALLTIPTFFVLLLLLPLLWHSQFVSIVMGVENCGVFGAAKRLAARSPLEALKSLIEIVNHTVPQLVASFVFCGMLGVSTFLLTTHEFSWEGFNREGLAGVITSYSYSLIACLWLGYSATTVASAFVAEYYSQSGR